MVVSECGALRRTGPPTHVCGLRTLEERGPAVPPHCGACLTAGGMSEPMQALVGPASAEQCERQGPRSTCAELRMRREVSQCLLTLEHVLQREACLSQSRLSWGQRVQSLAKDRASEAHVLSLADVVEGKRACASSLWSMSYSGRHV